MLFLIHFKLSMWMCILKVYRYMSHSTKALFSCKKFLDFGTVALSFVCDKYCLIID